MQDFGATMSAVMEIAGMTFNLNGHEISLLNVVSFGVVVSIVIWAVWEVILGDR